MKIFIIIIIGMVGVANAAQEPENQVCRYSAGAIVATQTILADEDCPQNPYEDVQASYFIRMGSTLIPTHSIDRLIVNNRDGRQAIIKGYEIGK